MQANKIDMNKKYRTRSGLPVRVLCVDRKNEDLPVVVLVLENGEEYLAARTVEGKYLVSKEECSFDLVEVTEWDDFKQDDKVLVSFDGKEWHKRYFNKVIEGEPYAFDGGITSWSADGVHDYGCSSQWKYCKKAEV